MATADKDMIYFTVNIDGQSEQESVHFDNIAKIVTSERGTYDCSNKDTLSVWKAIERGWGKQAGQIKSITKKGRTKFFSYLFKLNIK